MNSQTPLLVLGTGNRKKAIELEGLIEPLGIQLRMLADFPTAIKVVEDGTTFAENAFRKAQQQAIHLGHWVLGEDSGLMVDALKGAPGVYSARYAGVDGDDEANNRLLLENLANVPLEQRGAQFVCHATLCDPQGNLQAESEAHCRGRIRFEPVGSGGFGYDPLFEIPEYHRTFAELGLDVKAVLSHRARALRMLLPQLRTNQRLWQTS